MPYTVRFKIPEHRKPTERGETFEMYVPHDMPGKDVVRRIEAWRIFFGKCSTIPDQIAALNFIRKSCRKSGVPQ